MLLLVNSFLSLCICMRLISRHCQFRIDNCWSSPCKNNATCLTILDSYFCACDRGFIGRDCQLALAQPNGGKLSSMVCLHRKAILDPCCVCVLDVSVWHGGGGYQAGYLGDGHSQHRVVNTHQKSAEGVLKLSAQDCNYSVLSRDLETF